MKCILDGVLFAQCYSRRRNWETDSLDIVDLVFLLCFSNWRKIGSYINTNMAATAKPQKPLLGRERGKRQNWRTDHIAVKGSGWIKKLVSCTWYSCGNHFQDLIFQASKQGKKLGLLILVGEFFHHSVWDCRDDCEKLQVFLGTCNYSSLEFHKFQT